MKQCEICGTSFHPRTRDTTCSPECRAVQRKEYARRYHRENAEVRRERARAWQSNNADRARERNRRIMREKVRRDPRFALDTYLSKSLSQAVRKEGGGRWVGLLGYDAKQLKARLESTFTEGMTWDNYGRGGWSIDHVVPKSEFTYQDENGADFHECWALTNLRALWAKENSLKWAHTPTGKYPRDVVI